MTSTFALRRVAVVLALFLPVIAIPNPVVAAIGDCSRSTNVTSQADLVALAAEANCLDEVWNQMNDFTLTATPWVPLENFVGTYDGNNRTISGLALNGQSAGLFGVGDGGATFKNLTINVASSTGTDFVGALVHRSTGSIVIDNVDVVGNIAGADFVGGLVGEMSNFNNALSLSIANSSMSGTVSGSDFVAGLVGSTDAATISIVNTAVTGNVTGTANYVGGLIGRADRFTNPPTMTMDLITVDGNVTGSDFVAGLIGSTNGDDIDISNITVDGNVAGDDNYIAGLIGSARNFGTPPSLTVNDATITGNVSGESYVAGLIGDVNPSVLTIDDITIGTISPVDGNITGTSGYVGGLVGAAQNFNIGATPEVTITDTSLSGNITGTFSVGGLIGNTNATQLTITTTNITGNITGTNNYVAGLVGSAINNSVAPTITITGTTLTGNITGTGNLGGLIGSTNATQLTITSTNITGNTTGTDNYVAGLIGSTFNFGTAPTISITGTTLIGNITGTGNLGGLIGSTNATQLTITSTNITGNTTGTGSYIGGLIGSAYNNSVAPTLNITGTTRTGNTTGTTYLGGLIGSTNATQLTITSTNITGNTTGTGSYIGGLVGASLYLSNTTRPNLSVTGTKIIGSISGTSNNPAQPSNYVGGLVGASDALTVILASTTISGGTTATGSYVGGIVGLMSNSYDGPEITVSRSELAGGVQGGLDYVGGLIGGTNADQISVDTAITSGGTRTAGTFVGGLIGSASSQSNPLDITIEKVTVVGDIEGNGDPNVQASSYVGGLIGTTNAPTITIDLTSMGGDVTATGLFVGGFIGQPVILTSLAVTESSMYGDVAGDEYVGGLLGLAFSGTISTDNFFVRGSMTGSDRIGGFAGMTNDPVTLTNSYFQGTAVATAGTDGSFVGNDPMVLPTLTVNDSFCTDADCPNANKVQVSQLKSSNFLKSRGWDTSNTWCVRSDLNDGFPVLRNITSGALDSTPCRPVILPIRRVSLDPSGGSCVDGTARTKTWISIFIGYRYLPGADDCTRRGYAFAGWADVTTPTVVRRLPLLVDPSDGVKRYFVAENLDLVAVWSAKDSTIDDLTVFANFLCGPCRTVWLIHEPVDVEVLITVDDVNVTCNQTGTVFGLSVCELTNLTPGTHTVAVTPDGGAPTRTRFVLRS